MYPECGCDTKPAVITCPSHANRRMVPPLRLKFRWRLMTSSVAVNKLNPSTHHKPESDVHVGFLYIYVLKNIIKYYKFEGTAPSGGGTIYCPKVLCVFQWISVPFRPPPAPKGVLSGILRAPCPQSQLLVQVTVQLIGRLPPTGARACGRPTRPDPLGMKMGMRWGEISDSGRGKCDFQGKVLVKKTPQEMTTSA